MFKKGHEPLGRALKGHTTTKETKEKIKQKRINFIKSNPDWFSKIKRRSYSKENNPNWQGGKTEKLKNLHNKFRFKLLLWRRAVLKRDGNKCKNCGSTKKLEAHHIIPLSFLPSAMLIESNGVTLCKKCHYKTDGYGGRKTTTYYKRKGKIIDFLTKVIPNNWQSYETCGNYFFTEDGIIVIFVSDTGNEKYNLLITAHEMFESALVFNRKIPLNKIDTFDIDYEKARKNNTKAPCGCKPTINSEPGFDKHAPYFPEHKFATHIERLLAFVLGVKWKDYNIKINSL